MLRYLTAGESHGRALVVIVEGLPAGLPVEVDDIRSELARRRLGFGRGPRMRFEQDEVTILGGVRHGRTLGSPLAIEIGNTEWQRSDKWHAEMAVEPGHTEAPLTQPRPGHADLAGMQKYGFDDARNVLERASARETTARVAAGAVAKLLLGHLGVAVLSHVIQMGSVRSKAVQRPTIDDQGRIDESPVRCFDAAAEEAMVAEVKAVSKEGDSLGGVVEVLATGVPVGLGSHVHWDEVAQAYRRRSDLAGGVEGGMSTGELLVCRLAMKPLATLNRPTLETVDVHTKESTVSSKERTDVTAVPAAGVVGETMVALVLAAEALRKFGGDSLDELLRNKAGYDAAVAAQAAGDA